MTQTRNYEAIVFTEVGPDYCVVHHGIREEDEDCCDFAGTCRTCDGVGETLDDDGNPDEECSDCEGSGREPCGLRPLGYMKEADDA